MLNHSIGFVLLVSVVVASCFLLSKKSGLNRHILTEIIGTILSLILSVGFYILFAECLGDYILNPSSRYLIVCYLVLGLFLSASLHTISYSYWAYQVFFWNLKKKHIQEYKEQGY